MPGIVYVDKSNVTRSLTSDILFNCPVQNKKLIIRTGLQNNATLGYGLTLDATASGYSPLAVRYTNNKVCYIGTYSTGSSTYNYSYAYIVDSGYYTVTTRTVPIVEYRRSTWNTSSSSTRQVSGTEAYTAYYNTSPAYYKSVSWITSIYRSFYSGGYKVGNDVLYNEQNPNYRIVYDRMTIPSNYDEEQRAYTTGKFVTNKTYNASYIGVSTVSKGTKVTETLYHDPNKDGYNIASRTYNATSHCVRETWKFTRYGGYVESGQTAVTSISNTYSTATDVNYYVAESYYYTTVGYNYETARYYSERTAQGWAVGTNNWTHSNINV